MKDNILLNTLKIISNNLNETQKALAMYIGFIEGVKSAQTVKTAFALTSERLEEENGLKAQTNGTSESFNPNFTRRELSLMPLQFRKEYRVDGTLIRCRKRPTGKNKFTYEMRLRRDGYNVTATAKNLEECKTKFLERLKEADKQKTTTENKTNFKNFALYFYENFKKRQVKENTYTIDLRRLNNCLIPVFGDFALADIKPDFCQNFIDGFVSQGKGKTAETLHSLLNQLFKGAIKHGYITQNPLDLVVRHKHDREHGKALTLAQEKAFITACNGSKYRALFITALYTGMRPNEYATAEFKGNFVIAINSKRKRGKVEYKKIAISPMLRPFVDENFIAEYCANKNISVDGLRKQFYKIIEKTELKAIKMYDLRTTFYTRCEMFGVHEKAKNHFVGHSNGALADAYTDLPDDFLIAEAQKLRYNL